MDAYRDSTDTPLVKTANLSIVGRRKKTKQNPKQDIFLD